MVVELGRASGEIERVDRRCARHELHAPARNVLRHHLHALRRALNVAVVAGLVAVQPDVELEDFDGALVKRELPLPQKLQLFHLL